VYAARHAAEEPDRAAIIMARSGEVTTFAEYERRANQIAHLLRSCGLQRGDHISILMENSVTMLEIEAGAERCGLYFTLINGHLAPDEVAYILSNSKSLVFFSSQAKRSVAEEAAQAAPALQRLYLSGAGDRSPGWDCLEVALEAMPDDHLADESLGAPMLYSSGTTGRPKGVFRALPEMAPTDPLPAVGFLRLVWGFREGMTYLNPAPLYHSAPQASVSLALRIGATVVVMENFDAELWLQLVERYRVTTCQMVPTMFNRLLRLPDEVRSKYDLSSLEMIVHAAAPCPIPTKRAMIDWLGPIVTEYYAATELNGMTFCDSAEWMSHPGTVGKCILGQLLILDDQGQECPTGTDGTVWFDGATNFEYFDDPVKTAESRNASGTASTLGDVGHVDEDGYLYLTDRKSHMIISGGVNIYPQETENLLAGHPQVLDVAVIGVPNEDLGEEVKAVVLPTDPTQAGPELEAELIAYCRAHLAHFKCPRTVDFVDELPRLPNGKLYKRLLRDRYWEGHGTVIV
jgi:acyl-CoA synthetase (AMP-forming)/AMP-acid ligase II